MCFVSYSLFAAQSDTSFYKIIPGTFGDTDIHRAIREDRNIKTIRALLNTYNDKLARELEVMTNIPLF